MPHVYVREMADGEGLRLEGGELVAYAGGQVVGRAPGAEAGLGDAELVGAFPALSFSHDAPVTLDYLIELDLRTVSGRRAEGTISLVAPDGSAAPSPRRYPWMAERIASPLFRARPAEPAEPGMPGQAARGWAYRIPGQLSGDDPVLERRLGMAVLAVLADIASGRQVRLPARRRITNVFSASCPAPSPEQAPALDELLVAGRR